MKVRDGLAAVGAAVDHQPEAGFKAELPRKGAGGRNEVADEGLVRGRHRGDAGDRPLGNHKQVDGGLRVDVVDRDALVVLVLDPRRDFAVDDALENTFHKVRILRPLFAET